MRRARCPACRGAVLAAGGQAVGSSAVATSLQYAHAARALRRCAYLSVGRAAAADARAVRADRRLVRRRHGAGPDGRPRPGPGARRLAARPGGHQVAGIQQRQDLGGLGERRARARPVPFRRARSAAVARRRSRPASVIVQIYTDAAPEWLGKRYPDSSFVSDQGARIGSQASPGYCLDHAGVRADMVAFIGAVSAAAARHQSFYAIDVWSEPHLVNWVWFNTPVEFCYCPHTQARFRDWLKARYRTLDGAQRARGIAPSARGTSPRRRDYGTILSYSDFIDWKTFVAVEAAGGSEAQGGRVGPARRASGVEPLRCPGHHAQPAVGVRQS